MCRHCERLVEDVEHKELLHKFMEVMAEKVNRRLAEQKYPQRVTANEIDIQITATVDNLQQRLSDHPAVSELLYKTLDEMHK